jgi:hypothetical protein
MQAIETWTMGRFVFDLKYEHLNDYYRAVGVIYSELAFNIDKDRCSTAANMAIIGLIHWRGTETIHIKETTKLILSRIMNKEKWL